MQSNNVFSQAGSDFQKENGKEIFSRDEINKFDNSLLQKTAQDKSKLNPFNPEALRIAPGLSSNISVKKVTTVIPVRKPSKEQYVRTSPMEEHQIDLMLLELKDESSTYLVVPELQDALLGEPTVTVKTLIVAKTRQSTIFLWPLSSPNSNGRNNLWSTTAWAAANKAKKNWTRMVANMELGAYDIFTAGNATIPEPTWDDLPSMQDMLQIAFRDKLIDSYDHPILKQLRGEI